MKKYMFFAIVSGCLMAFICANIGLTPRDLGWYVIVIIGATVLNVIYFACKEDKP